jgi:hypothetical protein
VLGPLELVGVGPVDHECRVQVAVSGVAPAARGQVVAGTDRLGGGDRLDQPLDGHDDVLGKLAAPRGGDRG